MWEEDVYGNNFRGVVVLYWSMVMRFFEYREKSIIVYMRNLREDL